jgi:hypothetical protein
MRSLLVAIFAFALLLAGCGGDSRKPEDTTKGSPSATSAGASAEVAPCACGTATAAKAGATCTCADMRTTRTGWCDHCGSGMVAGTRTTCSVCAKAGKLCEACAAADGKPCDECAAKIK